MKLLRHSAALVVLVFAVLVFVFVLIRSTRGEGSGIVPPQNVVSNTAATTSLPVRLSIPSRSIDAKVQYVGLTSAGDMAVPNNFTDVGWYKNGPAPGQGGSAVIDGHVDNGLALAGVFKHVGDVVAGESIYIQTKDNETLRFVVYDVKVYPYKDVPMETIFAEKKGAYLTLITCEGAWIKGEKTYDQRLVVYAVLVSS